jgi:hypothetical protein
MEPERPSSRWPAGVPIPGQRCARTEGHLAPLPCPAGRSPRWLENLGVGTSSRLVGLRRSDRALSDQYADPTG